MDSVLRRGRHIWNVRAALAREFPEQGVIRGGVQPWGQAAAMEGPVRIANARPGKRVLQIHVRPIIWGAPARMFVPNLRVRGQTRTDVLPPDKLVGGNWVRVGEMRESMVGVLIVTEME